LKKFDQLPHFLHEENPLKKSREEIEKERQARKQRKLGHRAQKLAKKLHTEEEKKEMLDTPEISAESICDQSKSVSKMRISNVTSRVSSMKFIRMKKLKSSSMA